MGNYNITIQGIGPHHNLLESTADANNIAAECVRQLIAKGHQIHSATITYGGAEDISQVLPGYRPLLQVDARTNHGRGK